MTESAGAGGDPRRSIVDALRRYGTDAARLGQAFAALHRLQTPDLQALVAIMGAHSAGEPLTPGQLRQHLGLSSGGTSYVIDRLQNAGHVRRVRDHPSDHRVVHLQQTEQGVATGVAFFGPLGRRTDVVLDQFTEQELAIVERFMTAAAAALHEHLLDLESAAMDERSPPTDEPVRRTHS